MARKSAVVFSLFFMVGCTALEQPGASDVAAYCTYDNGVRAGSQGRAYYGNCPKDRESAFRQGVAYGRGLRYTPSASLYYERMRATEDRLVAATSQPEREALRAQLRDLEWWTMQVILPRARH